MARQLHTMPGGFSDDNIYYLSGSGAPGGDTSYQDNAPVGSKYVDNSVTPALNYEKTVAGTGIDKWSLVVSKSASSTQEVSQTAHGFVVGDWLYRSSGSYAKAQSDDPNTSDVVGIVSEVGDANTFTICTSGFSGVTGTEVDGSALFLSDSVAGGDTDTKPSSGVQKNLGFIVGTEIFVAIGISIELSTDEAPGVPLIVTNSVTTIQTVASLNVDNDEGAVWMLIATSATGRYMSMIMATHNGFAGDATDAECNEFGIIEAGTAISGLAYGVSVSGAGPTQAVNLTVVSTDSVNVAVRQVKLSLI